jgi:hypothetical protein
MARFLSSSQIIATRKMHVCIWCGEQCRIGESAFKHVYTEDGTIHANYFHPECELACDRYMKESRKAGHYENTFEPYEFARGSTLDKHDYKLENEK